MSEQHDDKPRRNVANVLRTLDEVVRVVDVEDRTLADVRATDAKFVVAAEAFVAEFEAACKDREVDDWDLLPRLLAFENALKKEGTHRDKDRAAAAALIRGWITDSRQAQAALN
jgi:hypothetical protein